MGLDGPGDGPLSWQIQNSTPVQSAALPSWTDQPIAPIAELRLATRPGRNLEPGFSSWL